LRAFSATGSSLVRPSGCRAGLLGLEVALLADGERLNRDGNGILAGCGGDLGGARQSRANFVGRVIHGDHHLEILGFLAGNRALRSRHAGGPQNRRVADFGDVAGERLIGDRVDGDLGDLAELSR
jgi:hypothetical protein